MYLAEKPFISIQGEGSSQGQRCLFIRFQQCQLRCCECDSKFSFEKNEKFKYDVHELNSQFVSNKEINRIVITGGEPLLEDNILDVIEIIKHFPDKQIEIETNGAVKIRPYLINFFNETNILFNISPKHNFPQVSQEYTNKVNTDFIQQCNEHNLKYIVKILAKDNSFIKYAREIQDKYFTPFENIYIQPIGINKDDILNKTIELFNDIVGNGYNVSMRLHVLLYNDMQGV